MSTSTQQTKTAGCLICGEKVLQRGLCGAHYGRYKRRLDAKPLEERAAFEEFCIAKRMLLPSKQGRRLAPDEDEFATIDAAFLAAQAPSASPATDPAAIDELSTADAPRADAPPKKSDRPARPKNTRKPA